LFFLIIKERISQKPYYYTYNCLAYDSDGNTGWGINRTFYIDPVLPNVTLISPLANFYNDTSDPVDVDFNCSATDTTALKNVTLYITNRTNQSFVANRTSSLSGTLDAANWTLNLIQALAIFLFEIISALFSISISRRDMLMSQLALPLISLIVFANLPAGKKLFTLTKIIFIKIH